MLLILLVLIQDFKEVDIIQEEEVTGPEPEEEGNGKDRMSQKVL